MKKNHKEQVIRQKALRLSKKGMSAQEISQVLGVRKMTVAAWKAHQTMGTYDERETEFYNK